MQAVEWGEYKLGDLFKILSSKKIYHANEIDLILKESKNGFHPYVVRATTNNGIRGYINENEAYLNDAQTLSFAQDTFTVFYQKERYFTGNKVKVLKPLFDSVTDRVMTYLVACFKKSLETLSWGTGSTVESIGETKIQLPVKCGKIDFEFMENFVAELESRRVAELESYLLATGLKDYVLTTEEEKSLNDFNSIEWKKFDITEIFTVKNTANILSSDIIENSGTTPYLCASAENNGVSSYITYDKEYLEEGNCIFIGGKTFVVSYQEKDFYSNDSHNLALYLENFLQEKAIQFYVATCVYKSLKHKYSWGDSVSKTKIKKDKIWLPSKNGNVDYSIMKNYISAIQKLVIKDVVLYADSKIEATKTIVGD